MTEKYVVTDEMRKVAAEMKAKRAEIKARAFDESGAKLPLSLEDQVEISALTVYGADLALNVIFDIIQANKEVFDELSLSKRCVAVACATLGETILADGNPRARSPSNCTGPLDADVSKLILMKHAMARGIFSGMSIVQVTTDTD